MDDEVEETLGALEKQPLSPFKKLFERHPDYRKFMKEAIRELVENGIKVVYPAIPLMMEHFPDAPKKFQRGVMKADDHPAALEWIFRDPKRREIFKGLLTSPGGFKSYSHDNPYLDRLLSSPAFEGMRFFDIGAENGGYSSQLLDASNTPSKVVRTNLGKGSRISSHPKSKDKIPDYREVAPYNIASAPLPEKFDVVVFKDVSKYLTEAGKEKAFGNILRMTEPGSVLIHGNDPNVGKNQILTGFRDAESRIELFVHQEGQLVEVEPIPFIKRVSALPGRREYLEALPRIVRDVRKK